MAGEVTLLEQAKSMANVQAQKIVNVFAMEFAINALMPYTGGVQGYNYPWSVADDLPTVNPRDFNVEFVADFGQSSQYAVPWKNYGGVLKIDKALKLGNPTGALRQELMQLQAIAKKWATDIFSGAGGTAMTGINLFMSAFFPGQIINAGATASGDLLTLPMLDDAFNKVSNANALFCTAKVRDRIATMSRTSTTHNIFWQPAQLGVKPETYNGVPVFVMQDEYTGTDILSTTEIDGAATNSDTSSLYLLRLSEDGIHGFTPDPTDIIKVTDESRDNFDQKRLEKNAAIVMEVPRCGARIRYIKQATA